MRKTESVHPFRGTVEYTFGVYIQEGILKIDSYNSCVISCRSCESIYQVRIALQKCKVMPAMFDVRNAKHIKSEVVRFRKFDGMSALAFIVNSQVTAFFGSFYIKFHPVPVPVKVFSSREKAINWLKIFRE